MLGAWRRYGTWLLAAMLLAVSPLLAPASAAAAESPVLVLDGGFPSVTLRGHLARLDDRQGALAIDGAVRSDAFQPRPSDAEERNYTAGAVWYRFTVLRPAAVPADWVLTIGEPFINDIRVFVPDGGGAFREARLGRRVPNDMLPLAARHHVVKLDLPEGVPATVYVRLASRDEIQFDAELWRQDALMFHEVRQSTLFGMLFATLILIVALYTLCGSLLRDGPMLAYAAYVATAALFIACHTGMAAIVFPSMGGTATSLAIGTGVFGNIAALAVMWDRVLDLRRTFPRVHHLYMLAAAVAALSLGLVLTPWYEVAVRPTFIATMAVTIASLGLAALLLRQGRGGRLVKSYVAAFIPFLFFSLLHAAEAIFPSGLDVLFVRRIGTAAMLAHVAILTVALAHRIALLQRERLRAVADVDSARSAMREHCNFVSMLSHQLRTPMAVILAAIDLYELKHPENGVTARIRRAVLQMRDLTADVLADSRLTEAAATLDVEPVPLAPLLTSLLEERQEGAAQRLRLDCGGSGIVHGDRTLLGVLFTNLLDNAIKYSRPDGEVRVDLCCGTGSAAVTVADDGPGIPPEVAERVFEKFYRAPSAVSQPGTGMGLYLVRHIAHRHGGSVSLASAPGRGTAFTVTLPLVRDGGAL